MNTQDIINIAKKQLNELVGHSFDVLEIKKPVSPNAAVNLSKIISKLSPIVGNLIEFNTCEFLNLQDEFKGLGHWIRQDPGFPDTIFLGNINPIPGLEIKAWFPLATEITARFKDSQNHFKYDQTYVSILAWLPEYLIFGKPKIIGIVTVSGLSIAKARDNHYHNPPDYLVLEPEDTTLRTSNLQQSNTNGYKFQGNEEQFSEAMKLVKSWGESSLIYQPTPEYQLLLRELIYRFPYRLDTNFAKMDRIFHKEIEDFKKRVYEINFHNCSIGEWNKLLRNSEDNFIKQKLETNFNIVENKESIID